MQGSEALVRVDVRDISEGGCFVEMHTLPPDQEQVKDYGLGKQHQAGYAWDCSQSAPLFRHLN
jgi:hypothetical protein